MAGVLKKGYLEVKTKGRLGSGYKRKFVILERNAQMGSKLVIVKDTTTENVEYISLDGMWTVQDKISRNSKRYPFELVICSDVVMTFSCFSVTEREDWTESFRTLNRLSTHSPPVPMADMYPVTLERSLSSTEVGVWGPCLLCIQDASIVLYSEDGCSKLHHWSAGVVKKMTLEGDQLVLLASRAGGDTVMEFHFNADKEAASSVMTAWNMVVIQSVANDPDKLNSISSFLHSQGQGGERSSSRGSTRGLFRPAKPKNKSLTDSRVKRSSSLTERSVNSISRRSVSPDVLALNRLSSLSTASQDSYTINSIGNFRHGSDEDEELAPPVPPRAPRKQYGITSKEEPDYSVINDEVGGSETGSSQGGGYGVVERQLDDLLRDILEDNSSKAKTHHRIIPNSREQLQSIPRSKTIGHAGGVNYLLKAKEFVEQHGGGKEPDDYLEPVPSKNPLPTVPMRRGNHSHSRSLPSAHYGLDTSEQQHKPQSPNKRFSQETDHPRYKHPWSLNTTKPASPPLPPRPSHTVTTTATTTTKTSPVLSSKDDISPYAQTSNFWIELGGRPKSGTDSTLSATSTAPPIPPRSPIKPPRDRYHSASSTTSSNSSLNNHRCRRCNGMKRSVSKTTSLDPHNTKTHLTDSNGDVQRGSLPDLHHSSPIPENGLGQQGRQGDCSSNSSSPRSSYDADVHTSCQSVASSREDSKHSYRRLSTGEPLRAHTGEPKPSSTRSPTSPPPYLQVVEDQTPSTSGKGDQALDSTLEMLNSVVKDLEELQVPSKQRTRPTDLDVALKQIQQVQNDLTLAKQEPRKPLNLHRSASVTKSPPHSSLSSSNLPRQQKSSTIHSSGPSRSSGVGGIPSTHHRSNSQGQQFLNGITHTATSPQVPPRSAVSLKQQTTQSANHHHQSQHHRPIRHQMSSPAITTNRYTDMVPSSSSVHRTSFPRNIGAVETRAGGGSTVFFHHIRDIKRTQC